MCVHTKPEPLDTTLLIGWTVVIFDAIDAIDAETA